MGGVRLTGRAHEAVARILGDGDLALDATAGNGHDTCMLAERVGPSGHVWAFDVQEAAITSTRRRLEDAGLADRVSLVHDSHSAMAAHIPDDARGRIGAVMFNLGYLPGSDRRLVTDARTTLAALEASLVLIRSGGLISLMVYRGHPGGRDEWRAVQQWLAQRQLAPEVFGDLDPDSESPILVLIHG